jgi:hypothetical protein
MLGWFKKKPFARPAQNTERHPMDDLDEAREFSIEVVYVDEDMIELAAVVKVDDWRGHARAYTTVGDVADFAKALRQFSYGGPPATFEAGADTGIGLIALRFYRIDLAGRIAGHTRLATGRLETDHRPEQVSKLALEFGAEAWAVEQFAKDSAHLARTQSGRAVLAIYPGPS